MYNNRINIIKYIEEKENRDIWDYNRILLILDGNKYSYSPLYEFIYSYDCKDNKRFHETVQNIIIFNKSQISNRIQYIKQSGYKFKEYQVDGDTLTIIME